MGLKVTYDGIEVSGDADVSVDKLLGLTNDDKEIVRVDGKTMRVKDAFGRCGCRRAVREWGFCARDDEARIWIETKEDDAE